MVSGEGMGEGVVLWLKGTVREKRLEGVESGGGWVNGGTTAL